ncbi:hypothetical protein TIFTF001_052969 [Ficus carica]|uniref:Uncharacterized protein n=1 Tax=Ficus carica TaxID=3494 RepID=A0AA88EFF1_FICCA|nr:hypothetical protein TIFTF001_052969 [Ficus carica]
MTQLQGNIKLIRSHLVQSLRHPKLPFKEQRKPPSRSNEGAFIAGATNPPIMDLNGIPSPLRPLLATHPYLVVRDYHPLQVWSLTCNLVIVPSVISVPTQSIKWLVKAAETPTICSGKPQHKERALKLGNTLHSSPRVNVEYRQCRLDKPMSISVLMLIEVDANYD